MSEEDREMQYGITILPDKRVYDVIENKHYKSLTDWASAYVHEDAEGGRQVGKKTKLEFYDDEY